MGLGYNNILQEKQSPESLLTVGLILLITLSNDKIELVINSCFTSPLDCFESCCFFVVAHLFCVFSSSVRPPHPPPGQGNARTSGG